MFPFAIVLCILVATYFFARYYVLKALLMSNDLDKVIADKLAQTDHRRLVARLEEENSIMRNLLLDMVENNTNTRILTAESPMEKSRLQADRMSRNREIVAEAAFVLRHSVGLKSALSKQRNDS